MFSLFFIKRPIFAAVISIVTVLVGLVALVSLPVARYPDIAPPTITVSAFYPGANAQTVADTVAAPIEQEVNGVEGMIYMSSVNANDGSMNLTVTFAPGTDLDIANVLVQNRVSVAESKLPEEVKRQGVTVSKKSTDVVLYMGVYSPDGTYDDQYLSNYVNLRIKDELARVEGVGEVIVYGVGDYSMRMWLDPDKLKTYSLVPADVVQAIREQNVQVAAGKVGGAPAPEGTAFEYVISARGRLVEVEEFANIVVKTGEGGRTLRFKDIGRVELGSDSYNFISYMDGKPSATIAIYQIPGSNMIDVDEGVKAKMDELAEGFPKGMEYRVINDSTDIIHASIDEVMETLAITLVLVIFTVYIFLQNVRATIVPALTIPVALIGTFAVLAALGFSINQLTLFGLVLVIGIVVDDAIVVVENATRYVEEGLDPKEATGKAMMEISGPVIATTLVLLAVFVPTIFMPGITGMLFKQFAVTISVATVFSSINALTLSPAMCGMLLRKQKKEPRGFFKAFNKMLEKTTNGYLKITSFAIRKAFLAVILFIALTWAAMVGMGSLPTGFVPQEDEGQCIISVMLPDGASMQRTEKLMAQVNGVLDKAPGKKHYLSVAGISLTDGAASTNTAFSVFSMTNWSERTTPELSYGAIIDYLQIELDKIEGAKIYVMAAPSLPGVGLSGGFTFMLQDRGGSGMEMLSTVANEIIEEGNAQSGLKGLNTPFRANVPQLFVDIDREQVMKTGTSVQAVFDTLQMYLGSAYVNDFTLFGRVFKVYAQADAKYRATPADIQRLEMRGAEGDMIPLGSVVEVKEILGPQSITRFNLYPSVKILGGAAEGFSSGQALGIMEDMADKKLPATMGYNWSELSYQEKQAGGTTMIFVFAVVLVYLVLAAQYESWTLPISVVLSVPTALLGAVAGMMLRGMNNDVYMQIGIVLLIGLATKSAILIVEFAKVEREQGKSIFDAAMNATRLRFRAVLMTAFSFILGVIPLLIASGAGSASRQVLGTTVFSGMLVATAVSFTTVPLFYYLMQTMSEKMSGKK
ncbi:MAG: multidrug efflux RND transporter permease subunit [Verrucomicrobiales bacterium]|nr:multidrug efflux RND transporter permease subunit [Verrucomicrobiales bacterium]